VSDLRLVARDRVDRLSDGETVILGRLPTHALGVVHVSFPEDTATVEILAHGYAEPSPPGVVPLVSEVVGAFDEIVVE
jgi:hypothetical protein